MVEIPGTQGSGGSPLPGLGVEQVAGVVREQVRLALSEAIGRLPRFGRAAKLKVTAGIVGLYGGGALVTTVILLLALAMPAWVAALIVGVVLVIVAAVVRAMADSRQHPDSSPTPAKFVSGGPDAPRP
ncbi:phage holin family protein [Nocardia sp. CDC160]|uniref:phage holin family protein n=1 Tax=Nocardia sp. CDC160 TaxID=3112166 RepID=UPI002DBDA575|nr:phage holin family protein [Nocardia sp. CDC160]MEC3919032.1 phage holin family protein [Nocardia sp. CDC160]